MSTGLGHVDDWTTSFTSENESGTPLPPRVSQRRIPVIVIGVCVGLSGRVVRLAGVDRDTPASARLNSRCRRGHGGLHLRSRRRVDHGLTARREASRRFACRFPLERTVFKYKRSGVEDTSDHRGTRQRRVAVCGACAPHRPRHGGRLEIGSEPPGALVALDGISKGVTPLVITDAAPGQHRITVSAGEQQREPHCERHARRDLDPRCIDRAGASRRSCIGRLA